MMEETVIISMWAISIIFICVCVTLINNRLYDIKCVLSGEREQ